MNEEIKEIENGLAKMTGEKLKKEIRAIIKDYYERKSIPDLVISRIEDLLEEQENENSTK